MLRKKELFVQRPILLLLSTFLAAPVFAQNATISVDVEAPACLPVGENGVVTASVANEPGGSTVRIYFRRLHEEVEDFYFVVATPAGPGTYRAVLPQAEDEELEEKKLERDRRPGDEDTQDSWAEWWKAKEGSTDRDPNDDLNRNLIEERAQRGKNLRRDWMMGMSDAELQNWLQGLENEPAEYYGEILDASGALVARSPMKVVEVRHDCDFALTPAQQGESENLVIGETAPWEEGKDPFHWQCEGIVSRYDVDGILRVDRRCRACVIVWWQRKEILVPAAAAAIATGVIIADRNGPPASPSEP